MIALLGVVLVAGGCRRHAAKPTAVPSAPVEVATAARSDVPVYREYPGTLESIRTVELNARVEGWLLRQHVPDGAMVSPGQTIYELDPAPFVVALDQAQADLAVAEAQYANAKQKYERNRPLVEVDAVSAEEFETLEAQYLGARATVEARTAAVEQAALNLSYCVIPSPARGQLSRSRVFEGTLVTPGVNATLNNVRQLDPLWVEFQPVSDDVPALRALMSSGEAVTEIALPASSSQRWSTKGKVVFIDNSVGSRSSTILSRLEFPNPDLAVLPGTYVTVRLRTATLSNVVTIPESAIAYQSAQATVWIVDAQEQANLVSIETGPRGGAGIVVTKGLSGGERVVTSGQLRLRQGEPVRVVTPPSPSAGGAPAQAAPAAPASAPARSSRRTTSGASR
ncbi:MAG: efflux RND transporter periplasmic adaptor subunit [Phycisphaeraceae bacterium]|nr:efflux RND transporter periplasmic adaptor subunit [Phycisphaeraceae bacterium]